MFSSPPNPRLEAGRYHSLIVKEPLGDELRISAFTQEGKVMGIRHKTFPLGVQFHPESVLTKNGKQILKNFLDYGGKS